MNFLYTKQWRDGMFSMATAHRWAWGGVPSLQHSQRRVEPWWCTQIVPCQGNIQHSVEHLSVSSIISRCRFTTQREIAQLKDLPSSSLIQSVGWHTLTWCGFLLFRLVGMFRCSEVMTSDHNECDHSDHRKPSCGYKFMLGVWIHRKCCWCEEICFLPQVLHVLTSRPRKLSVNLEFNAFSTLNCIQKPFYGFFSFV